MKDELRIVDWKYCQQIRTPYRSIEMYLEANMRARYDHHGVIGDGMLQKKILIAIAECRKNSACSLTKYVRCC